MTSINAYPAKNMEDRPMKVNLGKFTEGIGTVFTGVLQMLESIDVKSAEKLLSSIRQEENEVPFVEDASGDTGTTGDPGDPGATGTTGATGATGTAGTAGATDATGTAGDIGRTDRAGVPAENGTAAKNVTAAEKAADVSETGEGGRSGKETKAAKTVIAENKDSMGISLDDLTKIIVRKLKQDRANNGKIEAILKSYGVEKVCELPQEQYESFITEVATL